MLAILIILSILCLFLSFGLYRQLKVSTNQNPELSEVYKNKDAELQKCLMSFAKLQGEYESLSKTVQERDIRIADLEKVIQNDNQAIINLKSQNSFLSGENEKLKEENIIKKNLEEKLKEVELENKKNFVELEEKKKNIENLMQLQEQIKNQFKVISSEIIKEQKEIQII
mgnify:CR=1 FL=1